MGVTAAGRRGALALGLLAAASPAQATGSIACRPLDGSDAAMDLNVAAGPVETPLWVSISAEGKSWTSMPDLPGARVLIAQAFSDATLLSVDVSDDQAQNLVASLRVLRVEDEEGRHQFGYLRIHGGKTHPVSCTGP